MKAEIQRLLQLNRRGGVTDEETTELIIELVKFEHTGSKRILVDELAAQVGNPDSANKSGDLLKFPASTQKNALSDLTETELCL
ncbi:MAG TPA: hypothetical protein VKC60_12300 [Opitutaceae bacterium]|nr:hypothetical protein [Opitutaceae bacterium]